MTDVAVVIAEFPGIARAARPDAAVRFAVLIN
jgi:hypothetical protein